MKKSASAGKTTRNFNAALSVCQRFLPTRKVAAMQRKHKPNWCDSSYICAFSDGERHLGHIVYTGLWNAFDATCMNDNQNGYRDLGNFPSIAAAKAAVENSIARNDRRTSLAMACGLWVA